MNKENIDSMVKILVLHTPQITAPSEIDAQHPSKLQHLNMLTNHLDMTDIIFSNSNVIYI